jgi:hypothetical protein
MSLFDQLDPQERAIAETELNEWIDSQPVSEMPIPPTCGHCIHFEVRDIDGIHGVCRAKTYRDWNGLVPLTVHPSREATDEPCDRFLDTEAVPF